MELRQIRYFIKLCELGSITRAAAELGIVTSALSQQMTRLEGALSTRLINRTSTGVTPTDAGIAFLQQAQLAVRHADAAVHAAQSARLSGQVSIGLASTTASLLAVPFQLAMSERYPDIQLHLVEALSGNLTRMLNARQLDLAIVFQPDAGRRWYLAPLLDERLFLVAASGFAGIPRSKRVSIAALRGVRLVLPSRSHELRKLIDAAFERVHVKPTIGIEIDGLPTLLDTVRAGYAASIQPGAATTRIAEAGLVRIPISDADLGRRSFLASLSDDELSPAGLAARVVLTDVARRLVLEGTWPGATLHEM